MAPVNSNQTFNQQYSQEKYTAVLNQLHSKYPGELDFRVSESPIFLPAYFRDRLLDVCESLVDQILRIPAKELHEAIPSHIHVHEHAGRPDLMCLDFAICQDHEHKLVPALIELQACSTLNYYQYELASAYRTHYEIDPEVTCFFSGFEEETYLERMKKIILHSHDPAEVALIDYKPTKQKTRIDFAATHAHLGLPIVCLTDLKQHGNAVYYQTESEEKKISRIYNRFIFDEIDRLSATQLPIDLERALDLEWVVHPNWFFKISKHTMPKLKHPYAPETYYASDFPSDQNLAEYVLKPLFSFSGQGVILNPRREDLTALPDPSGYILQKKVEFAPTFEDPKGDLAKAEIRVIYSWLRNEDRPKATFNLVRMTKSAMSNVDHNKADKIWTGGSIAFFET